MNSFKSKIMFYMLLVCALAVPLLVGTTYAIYTLDDTEQVSEKVQLTTSNLEVDFIANEYINQTNGRLIKPDEVKERADFSEFTITNSKNTSNNIKYNIVITDIETSYNETTKTYPLMSKDFKWRLVSLNNNEETLVNEGTFEGVTTNTLELTKDLDLSLEPNASITYKLYIWLEETTDVQNQLLNQTFKSRVSINSILEEDE